MALAVMGLVLALVGSDALFSSVAQAGTLNHGDFAADTVMFTDVTEVSDDPVPLYGTPIAIGDTLSFFQPGASPNPSLGFSATAPPGDSTDGFLSFGVMANPGYGITTVEISEGGDYAFSALGSALAQVSANLIVQSLTITHVDGLPITPIEVDDLQSIVVNFPPGPSPGFWDLSSSFDIDQILTDAGVSFDLGATKLTVSLDNILQALADPAALATIRKKEFDVEIGTRREIPEPATCALAVLGLTMIVASRRSKM